MYFCPGPIHPRLIVLPRPVSVVLRMLVAIMSVMTRTRPRPMPADGGLSGQNCCVCVCVLTLPTVTLLLLNPTQDASGYFELDQVLSQGLYALDSALRPTEFLWCHPVHKLITSAQFIPPAPCLR